MSRFTVAAIALGLALAAWVLLRNTVSGVPEAGSGAPSSVTSEPPRSRTPNGRGADVIVTVTADDHADPTLPVTLRLGAPGWGQEVATQVGVPTHVTGVPSGNVFIGARADGYAVTRQRYEVATGRINQVQVALVPLGSVLVHVTTQDGRPVADAQVEIVRRLGRSAAEHAGPVRSAGRSSATGEFAQPGLAPGEYVLSVRHDAFLPFSDSGVTLRAGEGARRTIALSAGVRLRGVLQTAAGTPLSGRRVHVLCGELTNGGGGTFESVGAGVTDSEGRFVTPAAPLVSHYYLRVAFFVGDVMHVLQQRCVGLQVGDVDVGVLQMQGATTTFVLEGDRPATGLTLQGNVVLRDEVGPWMVDFHGLRFDPNRTATIVGLPDGALSWDMVERLPDGIDRSAASGIATLTSEARTVAVNAAEAAPQRVHCTPQVSVDGAALAGGVAILERDGGLLWSGVVASGDSVLKLPSHLPEGSYRAFVMHGGRCAETSFSIPVDGTGDGIPAALPGRSLTVRVNRAGAPSVGVEVGLSGLAASGRGKTLWLGTTDSNGTFVIRGLPVRVEKLRVALAMAGRGRQFVADLGESDVFEVDESALR